MSYTLNVVAVSGSLHSPSKTTALVRAILDALERELSIDVHLIELSQVGREFSGALRRDEDLLAYQSGFKRSATLVETGLADVLLADNVAACSGGPPVVALGAAECGAQIAVWRVRQAIFRCLQSERLGKMGSRHWLSRHGSPERRQNARRTAAGAEFLALRTNRRWPSSPVGRSE